LAVCSDDFLLKDGFILLQHHILHFFHYILLAGCCDTVYARQLAATAKKFPHSG
jgi:hypothetical protein